MSNTRSLVSAQAVNVVRLNETLVIGTDPTVGTIAVPVVSGGTMTFDGIASPAVTKSWHGQAILSGGALSLDLTALADPDSGATLDMTAVKMKCLQIIADAGNANPIVVKPGVTNGYTGWIGTSGHLLNASDQRGPDIFNGSIAVDATHKTIDLTGTGAQKVTIVMLFGP